MFKEFDLQSETANKIVSLKDQITAKLAALQQSTAAAVCQEAATQLVAMIKRFSRLGHDYVSYRGKEKGTAELREMGFFSTLSNTRSALLSWADSGDRFGQSLDPAYKVQSAALAAASQMMKECAKLQDEIEQLLRQKTHKAGFAIYKKCATIQAYCEYTIALGVHIPLVAKLNDEANLIELYAITVTQSLFDNQNRS